MTASRPGKRVERDAGAERHADQAAEHDRRQAHDQRQPHDREQRRVAGEHQLQGGSVLRHVADPFGSDVAFRPKNRSILVASSYFCTLVHMPDLLTTDEAADYLRLSRAQALRAGGERRRALHQGDRQLAVPEGRARPLAGGGPGRARGARARAGAADRRRQPRSAAGMGAARERLRAREPAGRQRGRPAPAGARRGDGGGDPSAPARRRRRGRQHRRGRARAGPARRGADRALRGASRGCWWRPAIRCASPTCRASRRGARALRCGRKAPARNCCCWRCSPAPGSRSTRSRVVKPACPTGPDIAQAVRSGRADCGIATRAVAQAAGLDFVPLTWERFDLVLRQRDYFLPGPQALFAFVRTAAFRERAARARRLRRERGGRGAAGQLRRCSGMRRPRHAQGTGCHPTAATILRAPQHPRRGGRVA